VIATEPITVEFEPRGTDASASALLRRTAAQLMAARNWQALEWICAHPLTPEDVLLQLAKLPVDTLRSVLGHRSGPRALLEHMANQQGYLEAVLTLALQYYRDGGVLAVEFRSFLDRHRENYSILKTLLYELEADNPKNAVVEEACRRHSNADDLYQLQARLSTIQCAKHCSEEMQIRNLYGSGDPQVLVALAENPSTPVDLLEQMVRLERTPNAGRIRHAAKLNLSARSR
jgi:hypothetical protein